MELVHSAMELHVDSHLVLCVAVATFLGELIMRHREAVFNLNDAICLLSEEGSDHTSLKVRGKGD